MKTILVALDGSETASRALKMAIELAGPLDARLRLLHIINWWTPVVPPGVAEQLNTGAREFAQLLLNDSMKICALANVPADSEIASGTPAEELAKAAEAHAVWMVIIGSHGRNPVQRILLGSVSTHLLHICERPVLVVR